MSGTNLVDKGGGVVNVKDEREVDAGQHVVARGAVAHRVVVRARVLRDHKRDAVAPVGLVAPGRPLAQLHAVALHNARAARRDGQKHLDPAPLPRDCSTSLVTALSCGTSMGCVGGTNSEQWAGFLPLR